MAQNSSATQNFKKAISNYSETVNIITNSKNFLVGETIYYKIYCNSIQNNEIGLSKIVYFELIDSNKKSCLKQKLFLVDGTANNEFFIPTTLQTGNYKLIAYTHLMLNQELKKISTTTICVINPYQKTNLIVNNSKNDNNETLKNNYQDPNIELQIEKYDYSTREKVIFNILSKSDVISKGKYSVSVKKIDALHQFNKNINELENINISSSITPELRGEIISGKIISKSKDVDLGNKIIALSIKGKSDNLKIVKTNKFGEFIFNLENKNSSKRILIQIIDEDRKNFKVEINSDVNLDFSNLNFEKLNLYQEQIEAIEKRSIATQIDNAYTNQSKDSLEYNQKNDIFFDYTLRINYNLDDYTRFSTIKETIVEVIQRLSLNYNDSQFKLYINDSDVKNEFPYPPLVLFDGIVIQNIVDILDYNSKNVMQISIIQGGYIYGSQKYNGVVIFTSKLGDYEIKEKGDHIIYPELVRPEIDKDYQHKDYSIQNDYKRIPDYRHQLLWEPNLKLENSTTQSTFYTSDIKGFFEISLEGIDKNNKYINITKIIEVK